MFAIIIGKREQGKSTLALKLALDWSPRVVIYDPRRQFELGYVTSDPREFLYLADEAPADVIIYWPLTDNDDAEFVPIADEMYARGFRSNPAQRFSFLVDEAQDLAKTGEAAKALSRVVRKTKTDTLAVLLTFHRPADVGTIFKALPTDLYCFRQTLSNDLEWLADNVGEEVAEKARTLPDHHFIHVLIDKDTAHIVSDPEEWYIPMTGPVKELDVYSEVKTHA